MPAPSRTGNVRKICKCADWKNCPHPWYLDFKRKGVPRYQKNLDKLIGFHAKDFKQATDEARRAITALLDGRHPADLQPDDRPTLRTLLTAYSQDPNTSPAVREQIEPIARTVVQGRPFGDWLAVDVTADALEDFRRERPHVAGNRNLAWLRATFNWAIRKRLVEKSPFKVAHVSVVSLRKEEGRTRRLHPGEEERLLAHARRLRDVIVGALETGCRKGELLSLQWHQVRFTPRAEIFLPAGKTKAKKDRRVPISSLLRSVLDARRVDPAGVALPPEAYVFGDEIGRKRVSIKKAWRLTCQRAGITGLHFHDLRREAGSRWMDAGVPLATIQRWLGHHNISQTSTYLGASIGGDEQDMAAYEARVGRAHTDSKLSDPFTQNSHKTGFIDPQPTPSDQPTSQIPRKNRIRRQPTPTVH